MSPRLGQLDPTRPPLRGLLRLPQHLYRAHLGWLLGHRFVQLTTRGRKTGLPRAVVLEVLGRERETASWLVASAWGARAQWLRNAEACPRVEVRVGHERFPADLEHLPEDAAAAQLRAYARDHSWAYRFFIGPLLLGRRPAGTVAEFDELARTLPVLRLRPVRPSAREGASAIQGATGPA